MPAQGNLPRQRQRDSVADMALARTCAASSASRRQLGDTRQQRRSHGPVRCRTPAPLHRQAQGGWVGPDKQLVEPSGPGAPVPATMDQVLAEMAIEHMVRVNRPGLRQRPRVAKVIDWANRYRSLI